MSLLSPFGLVVFAALGCVALGTGSREPPATHSLAPTSTSFLPSNVTAFATATPLPPLPIGNDACAFEDLEGLVDRAVHDWAGYSMSLLVETCPNVCETAFGTENPDISGPGVSSTSDHESRSY